MKIFVLGATGGTGRPIVRDAVAIGLSSVALARSKAGADLPDVRMIKDDARDEATASTSIFGDPSSDKVRQMSKIPWRQVLALALAAFFVVGSLSNVFAPGPIYEEYLRWGYPRWFHFVTGSLELTTAILLARARTRLLGSALGSAVMLAALATVVLHGEYVRALLPFVAATLTIVVGWITWRTRSSGST